MAELPLQAMNMNPNPSGPASVRIDQERMSLTLLHSVRDIAHLASPRSSIMLRLIVAFRASNLNNIP